MSRASCAVLRLPPPRLHRPATPRSGSSYSWTETRTDRVYHSGVWHTETTSITKTNPGGCDGPRGSSGSGGKAGARGPVGSPGSYTIRVLDSGVPGAAVHYTASERYNVALVGWEPVGSPNGILEPGAEFDLRGLRLLNNGGMPTPTAHPIVVTPTSSEWVEPLGSYLRVTDAVQPGATLALDHLPPPRFRIRHAFPLVRNVIPVATPRLVFGVWASRVLKRFRPEAQAEGRLLEVRYPLKLSLVYGARSITQLEEAPLVFVLRNVSTQPSAACELRLATDSPLAGVVEWRRVPDSTQAGRGRPAPLSCRAPSHGCSLQSPMRWAFPQGALRAGESVAIRGTLRFVRVTTPTYSRVRLDARMILADRPVQISDATVQLGAEYAFDERADFVLVASSATTGEEVARWRRVAFLVGSRLGVWNVSLYGGIDLGFVRRDGGSFAAQLPGRVLIVLNAPYALDATRSRVIVEDDLGLEELYTAAQRTANTSAPEQVTAGAGDAGDAEAGSGAPPMEKTA